MPYEYTEFDGITIPRYNRESDLSTAEAQSGFVTTIAGGFDGYGVDEAPTRLPYRLTCRGVILEASGALAKAAFDGLRSRWRAVGQLVRRGDDGTEQNCLARLIRVNQMRMRQNHLHIEYNLDFEAQTEWRGTARSYVQALDTSPLTFEVENDGNRTVRDAVLTIAAGSDVVRTINVSAAGGFSWTWDGELGGALTPPLEPGRINPGETLVFRMGQKSIRWTEANETGDVNGYYGFSLDGGHEHDDWLHIPPGGVTVTVAFTKNPAADTGSGTATLEFYEGWK